MNIHVHWRRDGSDCDGRLSRYGTEMREDGETMEDVLNEIVTRFYHVREVNWGDGASTLEPHLGRYDSEYEHQRWIEIKPEFNLEPFMNEDDEADYRVVINGWRVTTGAPHEEGGGTDEFDICQDPRCDMNERGQRDYSAEAMGY